MRPAYLIYKCRRCGQIIKPVSVPDGLPNLVRMVNDMPPRDAAGILLLPKPGLNGIHLCDAQNTPNVFGVTDLIGGEEIQ